MSTSDSPSTELAGTRQDRPADLRSSPQSMHLHPLGLCKTESVIIGLHRGWGTSKGVSKRVLQPVVCYPSLRSCRCAAGLSQQQHGESPLFGDVDAWGPFEGPTANGAGFSLQRH